MRFLALLGLTALQALTASPAAAQRYGQLVLWPDSGRTVIAHRGYSGVAPEHTFAAWDRAVEAGAHYLELDLQMTADSVLVVVHDATLDRTARGPVESCTGRVIEKTLAQLRECEVGSWFNEAFPALARPEYAGLRIPTLEEAFRRYLSAWFYIETKNPREAPGMEEALLEMMDRYRMGPSNHRPYRVVVQSFSEESLRRMRALTSPHWGMLPLVQLFPRMTSQEIRARLPAVREYAKGIGPHFSSVDRELVVAAHAAGLVVHPYTVNAPEEKARLQALGVDGHFTDHPAPDPAP